VPFGILASSFSNPLTGGVEIGKIMDIPANLPLLPTPNFDQSHHRTVGLALAHFG